MRDQFVVTPLGKLTQVWQERGTVGLLKFLRRRILEQLQCRATYQQWVACDRLSWLVILAARKQMMQGQIAQWQIRPKFSVIMPLHNVEAKWLEVAIQSVIEQIYPDWELCISDNTFSNPDVKELLNQYSTLDSRIKIVCHAECDTLVAASNAALVLATGDYVTLLAPSDQLAINALFETVKLINQYPDADFIYSDEDQIDDQGQRSTPFFKPDWSPDYFHACMYTRHLGVYSTELIRSLGGFRTNNESAQIYDLVLRLVEQTKAIYHIPKILYHARINVATNHQKQQKQAASRRALEDMVQRSPYPGWVEATPHADYYRVRRHIVGQPLISIIIPSAGKTIATPSGSLCLLENCVHSLHQRSTYRNFEIVLVDGYDLPEAILTRLSEQLSEGLPNQADTPNLHLVRCSAPFNFSQRINLGAQKASGQILLLLNDDIEVISPDWLESMLELVQQSVIGAVGAKLLLPTGQIQHVGVAVLEGNPGHAFHGCDGSHPGYFGSNIVNRNYLAVTAACLMVRQEVFQQVGGMDEAFPLNYNDVDFCLKLHAAGYRNVVTPYAQLIHRESISRSAGLHPGEWSTLSNKWQAYLKQIGGDPYYNPNFSHRSVRFEL